MNRRNFIVAAAALAVTAACSADAADDTVTVYQSPT